MPKWNTAFGLLEGMPKRRRPYVSSVVAARVSMAASHLSGCRARSCATASREVASPRKFGEGAAVRQPTDARRNTCFCAKCCAVGRARRVPVLRSDRYARSWLRVALPDAVRAVAGTDNRPPNAKTCDTSIKNTRFGTREPFCYPSAQPAPSRRRCSSSNGMLSRNSETNWFLTVLR